MAKGAYTYDPTKIKEAGKDRMRFELGDTMTEGGSDTSALTDEEIEAALNVYPKAWKRAKLMLVESLYRRFAFEVDTKTGPLTLSLLARANLWRDEYVKLKREVELSSCSVPKPGTGSGCKAPYFYTGMQQNGRVVK